MSSKTKTTATKEEAKPALMPKLRFPEFRDTDAWEPTTIGGLGRFYYGKSAPKWSLSVDAPTPCVRYGELYTKFGPVITETYSRTNTDPETLRFSKGGEILIPRVGEKPEDFGKCCAYLPLKGIAIGEMISVLETKQHPLFYTYYFRNLYKQFAKVVEGQNVKNLYFAELEPLPIHRPSVPEQQKVAECLSSVDELMAAHARKVDALKTHKKGLMQQLFPREGETQPRLRFPEFQNAGEWEPTSLGGVARLRNGYAFKSAEYVDDGPYQIITIANVQQGNLTIESTKRMAALPPDIQQHQVLSLGDILISMTGNVGRVCRVNAEGLLLNQRVGRLVPEKIDAAFFYQLLQRDEFRNTMQLKAAGGAQGNLSGGDITEYAFSAPTELAEQQRIASCLSSLDALITAEAQKLDALKTHKKGLMQQLFPSPEAE